MRRAAQVVLQLVAVAVAASALAANTSVEKDEIAPRVAVLLDRLESDDAVDREAATAGLIRLGPTVIEPLETWADAAPSPEIKGRVKRIKEGIARAWRYWDPAGGRVCAGLQAALVPADETLTFPAGGAILFHVEFRNVSPDARTLVDLRGVDFDLGEGALYDSPFSDGRVVIRRTDDGDMPKVGKALIHKKGDPRSIPLKTGATTVIPIRLDGGVALPPGEYEVRFVYYAKSKELLAGADADLETPPLRFTVVPAAPAKDDGD